MVFTLNLLPWEIFHDVFNYLTLLDLIRAFRNVSPYLNDVVENYRIRLDGRSMRKSEFEFLCKNIHPKQIRSIILSNQPNTIGQIDLFFSYFHLQQLINLQTIRLINVDNVNRLINFFLHLEAHPHLQILSIDAPWLKSNRKLSKHIAETLVTLPTLTSLIQFDSASLLKLNQILPHLTELTIDRCSLDHLPNILRHLPNLIALEIISRTFDQELQFTEVHHNLKQCQLQIQSWLLTRHIEQLSECIPCVESLILDIRGEQTLLDGRWWQRLIETKLKQLRTLQLSISPEMNLLTAEEVLLPFENPFWKERKFSSMAVMVTTIDNSCVHLYSVPYFARREDSYPSSQGFQSISLQQFSFEQEFTSLILSYRPEVQSSHPYFLKINTLTMGCNIPDLTYIENLLQISSIHYLKTQNANIDYQTLKNILRLGINIKQFSTQLSVLKPFMDDPCTFEQVEILDLNNPIPSGGLNRLNRLFPNIEEITMLINVRDDIFQVLNGFRRLRSARFSWPLSSKKKLKISDEWLEENGITEDQTYSLTENALSIWI